MRSSTVGPSGSGSPASAALAWANSQGFPSAARAIITASQPVRSVMATASAPLLTSPLPTTGTLTASFTVTGRLTAARTARTMEAASAGSFMSAEPSPFDTIFLAGQPMLMSR